MAYLNVNIPATCAQVRREYLYDFSGHVGEVEDCIIFGMASLTGRALLFHAIMENGAVFYRLPISAFIQRGFDLAAVTSRLPMLFCAAPMRPPYTMRYLE